MPRSSTPALLALLLVPHIASAATPTCVEQAVDEYENGGPCNLGDGSCLCSSGNQGTLLNDITEACVNDSGVMNNAQSYVQSFCDSMTGGGGSPSTSAGGYPTSSPPPKGVSTSYPTSTAPAPGGSTTAYPTMPGGVLPPTGNATTLAPGGGSSYPVSAPATTAPAGVTSYALSSVATITSVGSVATAQPPAPTTTGAATGAASSFSAKVGLGLGASVWGALLLSGML